MESSRAAEHLQVIRTLMERSALYRRALAPVMILAGVLGLAAAVVGRGLSLSDPVRFVGYWYGVGVVSLLGAFLLVRRQAWQHAEPFWSPPTRRVALAMLPPLTVGFLLGVALVAATSLRSRENPSQAAVLSGAFVLVGLPLAWVILYGCALHASGFFMTRGMRLFGWVIVLGGCIGLLASPWLDASAPPDRLLNLSYGIMGVCFGGLHLAYGVYLYFTEPRGNET